MDGAAPSLLDLSAKIVAEHIPFQSIEQRYEHIPEPIQRRIIYWSFPRHEDDVKMYSSLSSEIVSTDLGSQQKLLTFHRGQRLYNDGCVQAILQVGFNLSGSIAIKTSHTSQPSGHSKTRNNSSNSSHTHNHHQNHQQQQNHNQNVLDAQNNELQTQNQALSSGHGHSPDANPTLKIYKVSVTFDRCKITSVYCSCEVQDIFWCEHVVALILYRIRNPETVELRVPISETLLSLDKQQLQKLVQYIIAEHHTEVLPTAQRLLDEMRQSFSEINQIHGAPDPTAGARADDEHIWHLDEYQVNEKVQNYLTLVCSNSKDAAKQINALFDKIREMFRARDSNGTRLLKLITEQFLLFATRNEKSRPLWDQLVSLWVIVMLNPDMPKTDKNNFMQLLKGWSNVAKCPREDVDRRTGIKRKATEISDDEDSDDYFPNSYSNDYPVLFNQSNNYPAHMATHRHRAFQSNSGFPVLRPYNQLPILPSTCPCQLTHSISLKKMRSHHLQNSTEAYNSNHKNSRPSTSVNHQASSRHQPPPAPADENRSNGPQEPRSIFHRALDFQNSSWDDPHLQLIMNKDGPVDYDGTHKSSFFDLTGNPLWYEPLSKAAARIDTLRSHGYRQQALRLTVATVRRLKLQQDQWCPSTDHNSASYCYSKGMDTYSEGWIGHPFDPVNVMVDLLLEASLTEVKTTQNNAPPMPHSCALGSSRCSCPYNQVLADFTHRILPDLASSLSYNAPRVDGFPILPLVSLAPRRPPSSPQRSSSNKTAYYHVPVPGCCQKDSYLTLALELALVALGQQRTIPSIATAHDRAVRQEAELISKLENIDTSDPHLIDILQYQTNLLLKGGPFQDMCCGVLADSAPLHTFAKYLFDSLVAHNPNLAYKIGVYALKMPLTSDENGENYGAARTSPRTINFNHLQSEQLALAHTMLSKAKDESQAGGCLRKVFRASVKNIRNPASLLKLARHVLKEAKPSGATLYPSLLRTSFDFGLQVLKMTYAPHSSNGKTRKETILFIVECATDIGLDAVLQLMIEAKDYFSATEALNLVVARDNDHVNLRSQALSKLKLKDAELNRRSRDLVLECASRDPTNCALEALKFCETDDESLKKALKIVLDAGSNGTMDSTQLIKVADHINELGMVEQAFDIAMVAVDRLTIPSNSDSSSSKKDIFSACEYAQKVNGFSTLIPKLINNIECATVLSEIYQRFSPSSVQLASTYRNYGSNVMATYQNNLNYSNDLFSNLNPDIYKQRVEDARWWLALLKRTLKAFVDTTRTRLQNISPRHYGEFIDFLVRAQEMFQKASDGPQQFKDLISEIMKYYRTKKKLMERLKSRFEYSIKAI